MINRQIEDKDAFISRLVDNIEKVFAEKANSIDVAADNKIICKIGFENAVARENKKIAHIYLTQTSLCFIKKFLKCYDKISLNTFII